MRLLKITTVSALISFTLACSAPPPPPPPTKTVFEPLVQQLDRAKGVQSTVDSNTDATRKAVDEQERGDHAD